MQYIPINSNTESGLPIISLKYIDKLKIITKIFIDSNGKIIPLTSNPSGKLIFNDGLIHSHINESVSVLPVNLNMFPMIRHAFAEIPFATDDFATTRNMVDTTPLGYPLSGYFIHNYTENYTVSSSSNRTISLARQIIGDIDLKGWDNNMDIEYTLKITNTSDDSIIDSSLYTVDYDNSEILFASSLLGETLEISYYWEPELGTDFSIDYNTNTLSRLGGGNIDLIGSDNLAYFHYVTDDFESSIPEMYYGILSLADYEDGKYSIFLKGTDGVDTYYDHQEFEIKNEKELTSGFIADIVGNFIETDGLLDVTITVKDQDDNPLSNVWIQIFNEENTVPLTRHQMTNASGQVKFSLPNGTYSVRTFKELYEIDTDIDLIVALDSTTLDISATGHTITAPTGDDSVKVYLSVFDTDSITAITEDDIDSSKAYITNYPYLYNDKYHSALSISPEYDDSQGHLFWYMPRGAKVRFEIPAIKLNSEIDIPTDTNIVEVRLNDLIV